MPTDTDIRYLKNSRYIGQSDISVYRYAIPSVRDEKFFVRINIYHSDERDSLIDVVLLVNSIFSLLLNLMQHFILRMLQFSFIPIIFTIIIKQNILVARVGN